jgi:hypothetical protein
MFIMCFLGMFVYIFSISKEHILMLLFNSVVFDSVISWSELHTLYVYGRFKQFCSVFVHCVASSYAGAFFQLNMGLIGVFGFCSFIVACRLGAVGFTFVYFNMLSFCITFSHCFNVNFIYFW